MINVTDLTLVVKEQSLGALVTNALDIKAFVEERVKDYTPERYYDDPDAAKRDRAVLNSASKSLNQKRLDLEREFMRPFDEFKAIIKQTTAAIDYAASRLDEVVKAVEETQKNEKRRDIEQYFTGKSFDLVPLDRLFDPRWLNKGAKMADVQAELDSKIAKVYGDIKTLEALEDAADLKAMYLDTLDIGAALQRGQALKANRERLAKEAADRKEREHAEKLDAQAVELRQDVEDDKKSAPTIILAAEALEVKTDPIIEYTLKFKGTRSQLVALRQYMTTLGIEYERVNENA